MVVFPVLRSLRVEGYELFENDTSSGISHDFDGGVHLIVGINGLGKTTLLNILFRLLSGPVDIPKDDKAALASTQHKLSAWRNEKYFRNRVRDTKPAAATVSVAFGDHLLTVKRSLEMLEVLELSVDGVMHDASQEAYEAQIIELARVASYFDFFAVLRYLIFFLEDRAELVWDARSQFDMLRILFFDRTAAQKAAERYDEAQKADSAYRNRRASLTKFKDRLAELLRGQSDGVADQFRLLTEELAAEDHRDEDFISRIEELQGALEADTLRREKMRLDLEEARYAFEYEQQGLYKKLFPDLTETAEYVFLQMGSGGGCLVCGNPEADVATQIRDAVAAHRCPLCESPQERHEKVIPESIVSEKRLEKLQNKIKHLDSALCDLTRGIGSTSEDLRQLIAERAKTVPRLNQLRREVKNMGKSLPADDREISELRVTIERGERELSSLEIKRIEHENAFRSLVADQREMLDEKIAEVAKNFNRIARKLLAERCTLSKATEERTIGVQGQKLTFPCFTVQMTSGVFTQSLSRREDASAVSESQREFIDLAFRMALIESASDGILPAMLVLETPEASLDSFFMLEAGELFRRFSNGCQGRNVFIASTNLTQGEMIGALFGSTTPVLVERPAPDDTSLAQDEVATQEPPPPAVPEADRERRIINLLKVAAPNAALRQHREQYERLYQKAVYGAEGSA